MATVVLGVLEMQLSSKDVDVLEVFEVLDI